MPFLSQVDPRGLDLEAGEFPDLAVSLAELRAVMKVMEEPSPSPGVLVARRILAPRCLRDFMRAWDQAVRAAGTRW